MKNKNPMTLEFVNEAVINIEKDQTILQASLSANIAHYHICGGNARCSTCRVLVIEGMENLSPMNNKEIALRERKKFTEDVRLACQTRVTSGKVKLRRIIRDEEDRKLYVDGESAAAYQSIGEEKELVLFFLDIRNFTPFIENYLPFDVIHIMRRLTSLFSSVINSFKGKIIETPGDGIYAVFGFDEDINSAAENAYNAANKIMGELIILNENYITRYFEHEIEVGIGINAGVVLIGTKGYNNIGSMMVMGFPVVVAARLEELTKELNNNFLVSEYFYSLLNSDDNPEQKKVYLKGVSEQVEVRLMGEKFNYISKTT